MCYISSYFAIYGVQEIAWGREQEVCLKYIETRIVRLSVVQILLVGTALQIMLSWYLERKVQWMLKMLDQFRLCNSTVLCIRSEHTTLSHQPNGTSTTSAKTAQFGPCQTRNGGMEDHSASSSEHSKEEELSVNLFQFVLIQSIMRSKTI